MKKISILLSCLVTMHVACADDAYPSRAITIVVPQQAGGGSDIVTRLVAQRMSVILKQPVIIENRVGAGGNIGAAYVARAKPDGYTLLMNSNNHVINPALYSNAGYDSIKSFVPVASFAKGTLLLVANSSFAPNTVAELIAEGRKNPGQIFYSSPGNGTVNHLAMLMFEKTAGVKFAHVAYKGPPASLADVAAGQVPFTFGALASSRAYIDNGKLKVLAVTNEDRLTALPKVPTIKETVPSYSVTPWYGLFAPAGTPESIVNALHAATNTALQDPSVKENLGKQGITASQDSRQEFTDLIRKEAPQWVTIIKESGARVD